MNDFFDNHDAEGREGYRASNDETSVHKNRRRFSRSAAPLGSSNYSGRNGVARKSFYAPDETRGRYGEGQGYGDYRRPTRPARFGGGYDRQESDFHRTPRSRYDNQGYAGGGHYDRPYQANGADGIERRPSFRPGYREDGYRPARPAYGEARQRRQPAGGGFNRKRTAPKPFKRRIEYAEQPFDPNEPIRLNKFLSNAGVCSRRDADKYIEAGVVKVNGQVVTELGVRVLRTDEVTFHDAPVRPEKKVYVLLNKPKGYVTTSEDPQNRKTVMDLVKGACQERIYPVGRLDRNTTGVLLLTNDGELASRLTHPKFFKKKVYHVTTDQNVSAADIARIANGITLEDGDIHADAIEYAHPTDKKQIGIEIHSGKNRIVRRIFESLGYKVTKLDRVLFAGLTKKNVRRGDWRYLTEKEVNMLRMGAFE